MSARPSRLGAVSSVWSSLIELSSNTCTLVCSTTSRRARLSLRLRMDELKLTSHSTSPLAVLQSRRRRVESPGRSPSPTSARSEERCSICTIRTPPPSADEWMGAHGSQWKSWYP
eukprot:scaffold214730_cov31-Tisochrysis_lutea.AAC.4